jgi:hypothetical protein
VPSFPHPAGPASWHLPAGSKPPEGTGVQDPILALRLQEKQLAVHADAQQTPCAQNIDAHSAFIAQRAPSGFGPQVPIRQTLVLAHSLSSPHELAQRLPLHLNGSQVSGVAAVQVPSRHTDGRR